MALTTIYPSSGDDTKKRIQEITALFQSEGDLRKEIENDLLELRLRNAETELSRRKEQAKTLKDLQEEAANKLQEIRLADAQELNRLRIDQINKTAKQELKVQQEVNKKLIKLGLDKAKLEKQADQDSDKRLQKKAKSQLKLIQDLEKAEKAKASKEQLAEEAKNLEEGLLGKGKTLAERKAALKEAFTNEEGEKDTKKGVEILLRGLSDAAKKLEQSIDSIAGKKSLIDTRLQGTSINWDSMSGNVKQIAAISPLVRQEDILNEIQHMVGAGIAFNVDQRAFLNTIKNKIATTFDASNGVLLRLIRLQQADSTAARLGMESALNTFLNSMYATSEYLTNAATSVKQSLEEAQSLMGATDAVAFEYSVQKWLGSMYSVGMSDAAVQSIATTVGKLGSGDLSGVTSGGTSNLLLMAANEANLPIDEILSKGLDESSTNDLLGAVVSYLSKIYAEAGESKVLQQQFANVFGVTASDLKAATNLMKDQGKTYKDIHSSMVNYSTAMGQLVNMANSMYSRTSIGEMMTNMWDNFNYTLAGGIANNPALYGLYKAAGMLEDLTGGIPLPFINVWGFGIDLNTTIADLMRVGALAGSVLSGIGALFSGGGLTGSGMLKAAGIDTSTARLNTISRGSPPTFQSISGEATSESGYVGNASGGDVKDKTMAEANDSSKAQLAEASEDEDADISRKVVNENILKIYDLLEDIIKGNSVVNVKVLDYGLTGWN